MCGKPWTLTSSRERWYLPLVWGFDVVGRFWGALTYSSIRGRGHLKLQATNRWGSSTGRVNKYLASCSPWLTQEINLLTPSGWPGERLPCSPFCLWSLGLPLNCVCSPRTCPHTPCPFWLTPFYMWLCPIQWYKAHLVPPLCYFFWQ